VAAAGRGENVATRLLRVRLSAPVSKAATLLRRWRKPLGGSRRDHVCHVGRTTGSFQDDLGQELGPSYKYAVEFEWARKQTPVAADEAQDRQDANRRVLIHEGVPDHVRLLVRSGNEIRAVATSDIEALLAPEERPDAASAHLARVALRIDHEHEPGRDDEMIDVRTRAGDSAIVKDDHGSVCAIVEPGSKEALSFGTARPGDGRLRLVRQGEDESTDRRMRAPDLLLTPIATALELTHGRGARGACSSLARPVPCVVRRLVGAPVTDEALDVPRRYAPPGLRRPFEIGLTPDAGCRVTKTDQSGGRHHPSSSAAAVFHRIPILAHRYAGSQRGGRSLSRYQMPRESLQGMTWIPGGRAWAAATGSASAA